MVGWSVYRNIGEVLSSCLRSVDETWSRDIKGSDNQVSEVSTSDGCTWKEGRGVVGGGIGICAGVDSSVGITWSDDIIDYGSFDVSTEISERSIDVRERERRKILTVVLWNSCS